MEPIKSKINKMQDVIGNFLALSILALVFVIVLNVFVRYVLKSSLDWGYEVSIFIFGIYSVLSGAYCLKENAHVRVDILPKLLSEKKQATIDVISMFIVIIVSGVMLYSGFNYALESTKILERSIHQSTFNPQIWWFKWMIPLAALLLLLQAFVILADKIKFLKRGEDK